ncbi:SMI1/KNR4 family protein [Micromonospora sp. NPDC003241]
MPDHHALLARITARIRADDIADDLPAPLSQDAIARAEQRLGFRLHPLLAQLYGELANGGFGPDYQLLGLVDGADGDQAVDVYLTARTDDAGTEWAWPEGVLPILDWGCGMYACVDCRSVDGTVLLFEPNPGDPDAAWYVDSPSLHAWLTHYVEDTGWWNAAEAGEDPGDMSLWDEARARAVG